MTAPALLPAKKILQDLCKLSINWDDEILQEYRDRWERWKASLPLLVWQNSLPTNSVIQVPVIPVMDGFPT